ncbi:MAG: hypothetical protein WCQ03_11310 [Phycisphaerae bacterium]
MGARTERLRDGTAHQVFQAVVNGAVQDHFSAYLHDYAFKFGWISKNMLTQSIAAIDSSKNAFQGNVFIQNPHVHLRDGMRHIRLHARHGAASGQVGGPSMDGHDH